MAWPAVKLGLTQSDFQWYLRHAVVWGAWRPSLIVWHNTAAPSIADWEKTAADDVKRKLKPGITRIRNLENYFRDQRGWSGAPHLFIASDFIWVFNPLNAPGVHSPSWNGISIGIEMVGDFDREDDETGSGLKVKNNTIFATALLCETFGLSPGNETIKLHKDDPKTTHACPGENIAQDRKRMIDSVAALMPGGEHGPEVMSPRADMATVNVADLTLRDGPGVSNHKLGSLNKGDNITIIDEARNGATGWFQIRYGASLEFTGWVAARYVTLQK